MINNTESTPLVDDSKNKILDNGVGRGQVDVQFSIPVTLWPVNKNRWERLKKLVEDRPEKKDLKDELFFYWGVLIPSFIGLISTFGYPETTSNKIVFNIYLCAIFIAIALIIRLHFVVKTEKKNYKENYLDHLKAEIEEIEKEFPKDNSILSR